MHFNVTKVVCFTLHAFYHNKKVDLCSLTGDGRKEAVCVCVQCAPKNPFSLDLGWFLTQSKLQLSSFVNNLSVNKSIWEKKLVIQRNLFIFHKASRRESLVTFPFILPKEYFLFPFISSLSFLRVVEKKAMR